MGHIHKDQNPSRVKKFFTGNGFYLSLAACVVAVGGVAIATFADDLGDLMSAPETPRTSQSEAVDKNLTGVSDTRTSTTTASTTASSASTTTATAAPAEALYVLPLSNVVTKGYSNGQPVRSETMQDFRLHDGTDFAGEPGDRVMAAADGTVTAVEKDPLWGGCVTVDHGFGVISVSRGVTAEVKQGDTVTAGQVIGTLSSIPCEEADGPHLHLEIIAGGETMDPVAVIDKEIKTTE